MSKTVLKTLLLTLPTVRPKVMPQADLISFMTRRQETLPVFLYHFNGITAVSYNMFILRSRHIRGHWSRPASVHNGKPSHHRTSAGKSRLFFMLKHFFMCRSSFRAAVLVVFCSAFLLAFGIALKAMSAPALPWIHDGSRLVSVASSQIGVSDGEKYWRWCGFDHEVDWCACFVSWCAGQCCDDTVIYASCPEFEQWFRCRDRLYGTNISPRPGMAVFFDNDGNSRPDHMGILSSYSDGSISVIEGNSSGMCAENTYSSHDKRIISYGAF